MDKIVFLDFALFLGIEVSEELLHLFEVVVEEKNGLDAAEELVEFNVFFLSFVKESEDTMENVRWVVNAEHLSELDEVNALDSCVAMVLLDQSIGLKDIVRERL